MSNKKNIVDAIKKLYDKRLISTRDGNVSFKPKNENHFYISAGSIKKNEINEDQILRVDFDPNILNTPLNHPDQNQTQTDCGHRPFPNITGLSFNRAYKYQPSREIRIHSFLQTHAPNYDRDTFVVHAHPPNITAFIGTETSNELDRIKDIFPEINVGEIGKNVKYHHAGSLNLASDCFWCLKDNDVVGLERHGSLSIGDDIDKIFEDIDTLEYYIDIHHRSKNLGK